MQRKILIAASNYWNSPYQVGSHHYAKIFAKNGWQVLFVSDPISPFHFLKKDKTDLYHRLNIYKGRIKSGYDNISIYVPMALITPNEKPFFNTKFVSTKWDSFTIPNVIKTAKSFGFDNVDLLWFDSISQFFWIDKIKYKKSLMRIADLSTGFKKINPNLEKLESDLKTRVDNIIYSAMTLKKYLGNFGNKSSHVPNGADIKHFLNLKKYIPGDLLDIPKPIAIYIGAIEEWFGLDFLCEVALECADISFVIIGNPGIDVSKLKKLRNIYFLGKKDYSLIPLYIHNSDAGIITFNVNHPVVQTVNPIKLYEYMACGLPVVATRWEELELINSPAFLCEDPHDFSQKLKIAINSGKKDKYIEYSKMHSWDESYEKIIKLLDFV
ncbi:MAG: glycosyltransferase [Candidatus Humimicrobiaceae bacterium]